MNRSLALAWVVSFASLVGCRGPGSSSDEAAQTETDASESAASSETAGASESESGPASETDSGTDTETESDTGTDTDTDTGTDTDTESGTDTETESGTDTDTDTDTTGEPLPCADACGTPDCGTCPDTPQVDGPGGGFAIDAFEATVADYAEFLAVDLDPAFLDPVCTWKPDLGGFEPELWANQQLGDPELPVTGVDWCDAESYCRWTGRRLCGMVGGALETLDLVNAVDNEWYAACSNQGMQAYPYGANYQSLACNGAALGINGPVVVGSLPGCQGAITGLYDLSGNVWEWTSACTDDPMLDATEEQCRRRGGSFVSDTGFLLRCAVDSTRIRSFRANNTGIRCCE